MHNPAHILDRYLAVWEDFSLIAATFRVLENRPVVPALHNAKEFRRDLLACGKDVTIDTFKYELPDSPPEEAYNHDKLFPFVQGMDQTPFDILSWTAHSRRVFQLSAEMQHAFEHISVADIPIRETAFPFDSFLVELATPVRCDDQMISHLLVAKSFIYQAKFSEKDSECIRSITFLPSEVLNYRSIRSDHVTEAHQAIVRDNIAHMQKFLAVDGSKKIRSANKVTCGTFIFGDDKDFSLVEMCNSQNLPHAKRKLIQVVLNLCLYLDALTQSEHSGSGVGKWVSNRPATVISRNAVTDTAQVCSVFGLHTLHALGEGGKHGHDVHNGREITEAHWRRGHSRRKPGEGHDPLAPRSVRVKPTLVRPDLIPEFGLPAGSLTRVS